jgi:competence protein ComFC
MYINPSFFQIQHFFWKAMDFLFPPSCAGCDAFSYRFCPSCYQDIIPPQAKDCCPKCGNTLVEDQCQFCLTNHFVLDSIRSLGIYRTSLRRAILQLKFHRDLGLGDEFAPSLKQLLLTTHWAVDLIIPVPISPTRRLERGYNQADILAFPLALSTGINYVPKALKKTKEIQSQIGLSYSERLLNIQDAFIAEPSIVRNKGIVIVDDVITTGATINSCARALLTAGAKCVYGLSLAKTIISPEIPHT